MIDERNPDEIDFGHAWKHVLTLRWCANIDELRAAWIVGPAYARDRWCLMTKQAKSALPGKRRIQHPANTKSPILILASRLIEFCEGSS